MAEGEAYQGRVVDARLDKIGLARINLRKLKCQTNSKNPRKSAIYASDSARTRRHRRPTTSKREVLRRRRRR
jgi:hypothetical protein